MALLSPLGPQFFNNDGTVAAGCKLYTRQSGTTTPLASYQDQAGSVAHANPITLDSAGKAQPHIWLTEGTEYRLRLETAAGVLIDEWDNIYGIGDVESDRLGIISVKNYGAVGDGITSDQSAIGVAISTAVSTGSRLYWPVGTYVLTANISNFHAVRHFGPGAVRRGSDTFYVDPTTDNTNIIYIATTGSSSNDGLTASQPIDTLTNVWAALNNYGPTLQGKWRIVHAAGTYSGYHRVPYNLSSEKLVEIVGPSVGGHPNVPTAIYDANGSAHIFVQCINAGMKILVQDMLAREYEGAGISMTRGMLVTKNYHGIDNILDISCAEGSLTVEGGRFTTSAGYAGKFACIQSVFQNKHNIGYAYDETTGNVTIAANVAAAPQMIAGNISGRGVYLAEGATGHVYGQFTGWSKGIELISRSRANLDNSDFKTCQVAVEVEASCDVGGTAVYNKGGANENVVTVRHIHGGVSYTAYPSPGSAVEYRVAQDLVGGSHTGNTNLTTIGGTLYTLTGQDFDEGGSTLRMRIAGTFTGVAGTKTLSMRLGGTNAGGVTFAAAATGAFVAEVALNQLASASQLSVCWGHTGVGASAGISDASVGPITIDISDGTTRAVTLAVQLGAAADTIDVDLIELYRTN